MQDRQQAPRLVRSLEHNNTRFVVAGSKRDTFACQQQKSGLVSRMIFDGFGNRRPDAGKTAERRAWIEALFARQNEELLKEFGFDNRIPTS